MTSGQRALVASNLMRQGETLDDAITLADLQAEVDWVGALRESLAGASD